VKWRDQQANSLPLVLKLTPPNLPPFFSSNPDLIAQSQFQ